MHRRVEIRYEGPGNKPWRVYWSMTQDLAVKESFASIEGAGEAARQALGDVSYSVQTQQHPERPRNAAY